MRLVVQRVKKARVLVGKELVGSIGPGLFVLVGIGKEDKSENAERLADKLSKLRIMADKENKMNLSVLDTKAQVLAVSQFTLFADTSKGNRPSFVKAADPKEAGKVYEVFIDKLKEKSLEVETGIFGEYMEISVELDGPVTILLED